MDHRGRVKSLGENARKARSLANSDKQELFEFVTAITIKDYSAKFVTAIRMKDLSVRSRAGSGLGRNVSQDLWLLIKWRIGGSQLCFQIGNIQLRAFKHGMPHRAFVVLQK